MPTAKIRQFEVYEASNFDLRLQAFPEIRAFSERVSPIETAYLKLSISPQGIQTMIFRTETQNEFIEPYSAGPYGLCCFKSQRDKGKITLGLFNGKNNIPPTCRNK